MVDPNGQWGFSLKSITKSVTNKISRAASTVKNITRSISPKATIKKIVQSGSRIAANIKSKVTKVQQKIQKATKTVKNLVNPKTIKQKTRAIANGVKATTNSIKKTVSGAVSKAEKFMGAPKLALVQAAKTAKGAMVKYAMPNINRAVSAISKNPIGKAVVNQVKFKAGVTVGLFDAAKSTAKGLYKTGKYLLTTDPRQIKQDITSTAGNIKQGVKNAINNPKKTIAAIKSGTVNAARAFANADSMEQGRIVGRIGGRGNSPGLCRHQGRR